MRVHSKIFHLYLGLHSLLIGVFPFFIPVYLWKADYGLSAISIFIALAGLGFCIGLWAWDRLRLRVDLISLIAISLLLEILLLLNIYLLNMNLTILTALLSIALFYGIYNCIFWTTQRALFFEIIKPDNSGRKYGNLQIYVGALLQIGILLGGLLLEGENFFYIVILSALIALIGFIVIYLNNPKYPTLLKNTAAVGLRDLITFRDSNASRTFFMTDGIFLFLESFFWVISLFLIVRESFAKLGIMILALAVICAILFLFLKNIIDRVERQKIYRAGVVLYAISWGLRAIYAGELSLELLFILLVLITFSTALFRLLVNKRFYDIAHDSIAHRYLVLKSYYSQAIIFICFLAGGAGLLYFGEQTTYLPIIYWAAAAGSFVYLIYGRKKYQ